MIDNSFHIITFGCQMNVHDSQWLARALEARGPRGGGQHLFRARKARTESHEPPGPHPPGHRQLAACAGGRHRLRGPAAGRKTLQPPGASGGGQRRHQRRAPGHRTPAGRARPAPFPAGLHQPLRGARTRRRYAVRARGLREHHAGLRQFLRLLHRALYPRPPEVPSDPGHPRRMPPPAGPRRARDHPAGAERQRLRPRYARRRRQLCRPAGKSGRPARPEAPALRDAPSQGHGPRRRGGLREHPAALPAPAPAPPGRFRRRAQAHGPQVRQRPLSGAGGQPA